MECLTCGVHTFSQLCTNCGSRELRAVVLTAAEQARALTLPAVARPEAR